MQSVSRSLSAGFDGGMRQWFLMEIYDQHSGQLQANISAKFAALSVTGLDAGRLFRIYVYAVNGRGRSDGIALDGYTLKAAEKQTGKWRWVHPLDPWIFNAFCAQSKKKGIKEK